MAYIIAVVVLLVLPAVAVAARKAARYRYGANDASSRRARTNDRRAASGPVFHIGATPVPQRVSPWRGDQQLRREFDLDNSNNQGRAA